MLAIDRENRNNAMTSDKCISKRVSSIKPLRLAVQVGLICGLAAVGMSSAFAGSTEQAKRIHDRLAGVPPTNEVLCAMAWYIDNAADPKAGAEQAAQLIMATSNPPDPSGTSCNASGTIDTSESRKAFYSTSLKNFVMPATNEAQTAFAPLNDYVATVIGMIRDDVPFDEVLSKDILYRGVVGGLPALNAASNAHYEALEAGAYDLSSSAVLDSQSQVGYLPAGAEPAGVVTTRAASLAFFSGGTNRLMWRATSMNYLCRDLEEMKDTTRPPDRIRQDVSRSPGGDSSIFLNACLGCHAGMDPLVGAYAYYDHTLDENGEPSDGMLWKANSSMFPGDDPNDPSLTTLTNGVTQKYRINSSNFEYGYVTVDNHWTNYWRKGPNEALEWGWSQRLGAAAPGEKAEGYGPASLGEEVTSTRAFAKCQVEKVYKHVCFRDPITTEGSVVDTIATAFKNSTYNMKTVFAKVAAQCMGD